MASDQEALILQVSADVSRLQKQFDKAAGIVNDGSAKMEKRAKGLATSVEDAFEMPNVEKSLQKVFDSARFATFEEGGAKLRIFGSALEPLGGMGLAAAAGLAAFGIAVEQAMKAAEFADQLEEVSKKLGISTDDLQKWDFIATQTAIPVNAMRDSLGALNKSIGLVQSGLAKTQLTRAFAALDITPDQLRRLGDVSNVLPVIIERAAKLNSSERAAVGERLGVTPDVLNGLIIERDRLADLNAEAEKYGIIINRDVIARSAEAADKLKFASDIIDKNLKASFADLAPFIATASLRLAEFIHLLLSVPQSKTQAGVKYVVQGALGQLLGQPGILGEGVAGDGQAQRLALTPSVAALKSGIADLLNQPGSAKALVQPTGGHRGDILKASLDAIAQAAQAELVARKALAESVEEQLALEKAEINTAADKKVDDLRRQAADKKITEVAARQAIALTEQERDEKLALAQRQADWKVEDQQDDVRKALFDAQLAELQAQLAITTDQQERAKLEEQILRLQHVQAWHEQGKALSREVQTGAKTQDQADQILQSGNDARAAETRAKVYQDTYQPIHDALDAAVRGGWPGLAQYMADKLREKFVDALADVFTNMVLGGGNGGGGGGGNLFAAAFSDIGHLFGFANGTTNAPGGLAIVGERGPELVNLPRGSQVIPSPQTAQLLAGGSRNGSTIVFDLRGGVVTQDLLDQMNGIANSAAHQAVAVWAPTIARSGASLAKQQQAYAAYNRVP